MGVNWFPDWESRKSEKEFHPVFAPTYTEYHTKIGNSVQKLRSHFQQIEQYFGFHRDARFSIPIKELLDIAGLEEEFSCFQLRQHEMDVIEI